ncbi:MAG: tetratricopeptide repeat protein [Rhodanobacteraceae bacterium]|nr:tetratricopeptide repeat protein [Rhodanobacteraceae bacterium]
MLVTAVAAVAAEPAADSELVVQCRRLQQIEPAEAIDVCERAFAALDTTRASELATEMLFRRSDAQIATGNFAAASLTLDRVAALPAEPDRWKRDFRLVRRRGILAYRQEHYAEALLQFRSARELASAHGDTTALGQSWNDLGNALRRIGDFPGALDAYLASLDLKRKGADEQLGTLYNNLGDLYRDLGDLNEARKRYGEALVEHDRENRMREAAHTRESLAAVLAQSGDVAAAADAYAQAIGRFHELGARADELRARVALAELELDRAGWASARAQLVHAQDLAAELALPLPVNLAVQLARLYQSNGDIVGARRVLEQTLRRVPAEAADRGSLLQASAEAALAAGDPAEAYALLKEFHAADTRVRNAAHDSRLAQLRVQFEVAERQRAIDALKTENRLAALALAQRTTQLQLGLSCALVVMLLVVGLFLRARQRSRLAAVVRESQLAAEADQYRRAAESLRADGERVRLLLDRSDTALLAIDAAGVLVAVTARAAVSLGRSREAVLGRPLAELLGAESRERLQSALSAIDDQDGEVSLRLELPAATVMASLAVLPVDAGVAVVRFAAAEAVPADGAGFMPEDLEHGMPGEVDAAEADTERFRRELVELMIDAVEIWERVSGGTRIDLAEKSRVWRVTIDEGRLRVRAMERYLSLSRLPRQPRWREVLRTAFYVLSECRLDDAERDALRSRVESIQASLRRRALL